MGLFGNLKTEGMEEVEDRIGGGYSAKETDIYTGEIKMAYAGKSSGGAHSVTFILAGGDFGKDEYRETIYITNRNGDNFYAAKDKSGNATGKNALLPGFIVANDMALLTVGQEITELDGEDKMVNIYDYDAKKEIPKSVPVLTALLGQTVSVAIQKTTESQTTKEGTDYVPKADGSTRDVNNIVKVFNTEHRMTVSEAKSAQANADFVPTFWDAWLERNKGKTIDKTAKGGQNGTAGKPGGGTPPAGGTASGGAAAPRTSLFAKK